MEIITENTAISIGLVVLLIGGAAWLTTLHVSTLSNGKRLSKIQDKNEESDTRLRQRIDKLEAETNTILERMARMETKLDFIIESIKK